jgi:outer membrane immunogenic protein
LALNKKTTKRSGIRRASVLKIYRSHKKFNDNTRKLKMKIKLLVVTAATVMASSAISQSAFQGFYGQLATGYEGNSASNLNLNDSNSSGPLITGSTTFSANTQSFGGAPLVVGIGYNFSVAPKWLLGVGVDYSALSQTSSSFSQTVTGSVSNGVPSTEFNGFAITGNTIKTSNRVNIFIAPGYEIDKDKLVFFKAGYSMMNVKSQSGSTLQSPEGFTFPEPSQSANKNVNGFILGLGYKQIISGGVYGFAEGNYMSYGKANLSTTTLTDSDYILVRSINPSLSSYQLLVGVGYKF